MTADAPRDYGRRVVDIEQLNPRNEAALRAWWEVGHAATAGRPGAPWPVWEQSRVSLPADNPEGGITLLAAIDGREMVGAGLLVRPLRDNLHTATVDAYVRPDRTREGIGRRLVDELEVIAAGDGRTTLHGEAFLPPGVSGTGPEAFATAMGYEVASRESIRELALADFLARRPALGEEVVVASGYRIVTFDTECPEEHVESFGRLLGMLLDEIPLGELDLRASEWSVERIRAAEQRQLGIGRHVLTALAIAPDGSVAGSSDVRVNDTDTTRGQVGITLVDPAHRGRRLGLALKITTHDLALATYPSLETVDTSNAEVNTHMNVVNDALGYRTLETLLELQKKL